jgi:hypothetical protein
VKKNKTPKQAEAIRAVRQLAAKYGVPTMRWAVRKWDKGMAEKKKLLKLKRSLEEQLHDIKRGLR